MPTIIKGYEVISQIGSGAFCKTHRVRKGGKVYAMKIFKPDAIRTDVDVKRFQRECRALQKIVSDHVVRYHDHGVFDVRFRSGTPPGGPTGGSALTAALHRASSSLKRKGDRSGRLAQEGVDGAQQRLLVALGEFRDLAELAPDAGVTAGRRVLDGTRADELVQIMSDGKSLEHTGVVPEEVLLPSAEDLAGGRGPVLSRAASLCGVEIDPATAGGYFPIEWKR